MKTIVYIDTDYEYRARTALNSYSVQLRMPHKDVSLDIVLWDLKESQQFISLLLEQFAAKWPDAPLPTHPKGNTNV